MKREEAAAPPPPPTQGEEPEFTEPSIEPALYATVFHVQMLETKIAALRQRAGGDSAMTHSTKADKEFLIRLIAITLSISKRNRRLKEALEVVEKNDRKAFEMAAIARAALAAESASGEATQQRPDDALKRCTHCGFIVDTKYKAEFPK